MKQNNRLFVISISLLIVLLVIFALTLLPELLAVRDDVQPEVALGYGTSSVKGVILDVVEEGVVQLGDVSQSYQVLRVEVLEGEYQGLEFKVDYGKNQIRPEGLHLSPGDQIVLGISKGANNLVQVQFLDFVRLTPLFILLATFVLFSVIISGWKGVRGLLGMGLSLGVIIYYIIPQILAGKDPILVSVTGAFFLLAASLYLIYGWTLKTHAAVLGTLLSLILTAFLAEYFVKLTRLTGFGSEEALFLLQQSGGRINMQGLVLGGMLIGALGVLDDLVITQASVVFELHNLNPVLDWKQLFQRAMRVGQDHVAATVNTLVLAYAGAALPMFILFSISGESIGHLLNLEYVAEEVVRTLVGSLGLIAGVPLTTILASLIVFYYPELGPWKGILGPLVSGENSHDHAGHGSTRR